MSQEASVWLVIGLAVLAANLPFASDRLLVLGPRFASRKPLSVCIGELALLYALVGLIAFGLERQMGLVAVQGWEFYAVTGTSFLTLAFPGFVFRFLIERRFAVG